MIFLNVCEKSDFLNIILLGKQILDLFSLLVPIVLILMVSIDLGKIVLGDEKATPKATKAIIHRTIAAVMIFFVPSIVNLLLSFLGEANFTASDCWRNANNKSIAEFKAIEEANKKLKIEALGKEKQEADEMTEELEKLREEYRKENEEEANKYSDLNGGMMLGDVVYYNQCDFKQYPYGSYGTICSHGCGPTSAAVIASTFLGTKNHSPVDTTKWICAHGGCTSGGSYASVCAEYLKEEGLNVSPQYSWTSSNVAMLMEKLATGDYLAFILVHNNTGRGIFTKGGHYFVLTGVENGEFTIAQVSNPSQNEKTWPLSAFNGDALYFYLVSEY